MSLSDLTEHKKSVQTFDKMNIDTATTSSAVDTSTQLAFGSTLNTGRPHLEQLNWRWEGSNETQSFDGPMP